MSKQVISGGIKGLQRFLQSDRRFAATPILIIAGQLEKGHGVVDVPAHVHFLLAQQLGFRTIFSDSLGKSAFPTVETVAQQQELAARVGASTICAVGSDAAVHLGRAVVADDSHAFDDLILVPASFSGVIASSMNRGLLIDSKEETLVPSAAANVPDIIVTPSSSDTQGNVSETTFALLAFLLSRQIQGTAWNEDIKQLLERFVVETNQSQSQQATETLLSALVLMGQGVHWGLGSSLERRDIPLAITSALLPQVFPDSSALGIAASLVPTLVDLLEAKSPGDELGTIYRQLVDCLGEPINTVSNQSADTLLGIVRENQTAWKSLDAPADLLHQCLRAYSLVD